MRVRKLKNGKAASMEKVTGEMIKGGGDRVVDWIWNGVTKGWKRVLCS